MRSTWKGRAGVLVGVAAGLAAGGIAYAAIPGSQGALQSPLATNHVFLVGSSGPVAIGPYFGTRVGFGSTSTHEAAVSMPEAGTLSHLHAALDHNLTSATVHVSIWVNGTETSIGCTINSGHRRCSDKIHSAGFNEGDQVDAWVANNTGTDVYATWAVRAG
jgi:hypothetical protein